MQQSVYAIVLNYNSADDCRKCVSFLKQQEYANLTVLVIDNNSSKSDQKNKLLEIQEEFQVEMIFNKENRGYSAGNNIGLRKAVSCGAEWCLIINPDVVLDDKNYVSDMMIKCEEYPKTVVAASKMLLPSGDRQNPYKEISYGDEVMWLFDAIQQKCGKHKTYLMEDRTGYCQKVSGCCFFIKSAFLKEIGFLDENVFLYCEEPILASQVRNHGYKELYVSELVGHHNHIPSQKGATGDRMSKLLESRMYYLRKHSGYRGIALWIALGSKKLQKLFWKVKG